MRLEETAVVGKAGQVVTPRNEMAFSGLVIGMFSRTNGVRHRYKYSMLAEPGMPARNGVGQTGGLHLTRLHTSARVWWQAKATRKMQQNKAHW